MQAVDQIQRDEMGGNTKVDVAKKAHEGGGKIREVITGMAMTGAVVGVGAVILSDSQKRQKLKKGLTKVKKEVQQLSGLQEKVQRNEAKKNAEKKVKAGVARIKQKVEK